MELKCLIKMLHEEHLLQHFLPHTHLFCGQCNHYNSPLFLWHLDGHHASTMFFLLCWLSKTKVKSRFIFSEITFGTLYMYSIQILSSCDMGKRWKSLSLWEGQIELSMVMQFSRCHNEGWHNFDHNWEKMGSTICFLTYLSQYQTFLGLRHSITI